MQSKRFAIVIAAGLLGMASPSFAFSGGTSTSSMNRSDGCGACHSGGSAPTVAFLSNGAAVTSVDVLRGASVNLVFAITPPSPTQASGGATIYRSGSSSSVTLSENDPMLTAANGSTGVEIVHAAPKSAAGSRIDFPFTVEVQSTAVCGTTTTLGGWGVAADKNNAVTGDGSRAATLNLRITCPPETSSSAGTATTTSPTTTAPPSSRPGMTEADASRILMSWISTNSYYRSATPLFTPGRGTLQDSYWTFELVSKSCPAEVVDRWGVETTTKAVMRRSPDGRFVRP